MNAAKIQELLSVVRTCAPECIGYGPARMSGFREGWDVAMNAVWQCIGDLAEDADNLDFTKEEEEETQSC